MKNLSALQEMQVRSLGWADLLGEGMATHSSILAWRIAWTEEALWTMVHRVSKSWTQLKRLSRDARVLPKFCTFSQILTSLLSPQ